MGRQEIFTARYRALLSHYGLEARATQAAKPHENGDVEQRHYRFKQALDQALMLRGSRAFDTRRSYERFVRRLLSQLNAGRKERVQEEFALLRPLPQRRLERLHRTHREEGLVADALTDYHQALDAMRQWQQYYNHQRPHWAIQYLCPIDYYRGDPASRTAQREQKLVQGAQRRRMYWQTQSEISSFCDSPKHRTSSIMNWVICILRSPPVFIYFGVDLIPSLFAALSTGAPTKVTHLSNESQDEAGRKGA